uniref:SWIM-type domain-containing protein n=1 Tax=Panagrolaimus sp. ES5 TaxID=591445 RepID=A0AC34GES8_9BILA
MKGHFEDWTNKDPLIMNTLFGATQGTVQQKAAFDEFDPINFSNLIKKLAKTSEWQKYPELQKWANAAYRVERYFNGYGLLFRIKGGWGFDFATANFIECQNMLMKAGQKKMALQDLIVHLLDYVTKQIQSAAMTLVGVSKYHLKDHSKVLGKVKWAALTPEEKQRIMETIIGIIETSKLKGFSICIVDIPSELLPKFSEMQRFNLVQSAKTYLVFDCSPEEPEAFVVTKAKECYKVFGKETPIKCPCMINQKDVNVCQHIIAADLKFPKYKLVDKIVTFLNNEKEKHRIQRQMSREDANKGSTTSRRSGS